MQEVIYLETLFNLNIFIIRSAENANQSDIIMSDVFDQIDSLEHNDGTNECVICFERKPEVTLPCAHSYCNACIEEWYVSIYSLKFN